MSPPKIARILFQWSAAATNVFRLHFDTGKGTLDVYTDGAHDTCTKAETGGKCWESAADTLMPYLDAASGGKVDLQISAPDPAAPSTLSTSPNYVIHVPPHRLRGAIYYSSTPLPAPPPATLPRPPTPH